MIGTTSYGISDQLRDILTPYACVVGYFVLIFLMISVPDKFLGEAEWGLKTDFPFLRQFICILN